MSKVSPVRFKVNEKYVYATPDSSEETARLRRAGFFFDRSEKIWKTPFTITAKKAWFREKETPLAKALKRRFDMSSATGSSSEYPAPEGLSYLPFQIAGIDFLLENNNVLLSDPMGLGKTIEAIGLINADRSIKRILVICPASLKLNWLAEIRKWLVPDLSVSVWGGSGGLNADIIIVNYDIIDRFYVLFRADVWDLLILDESHYLKTLDTKRTLNVIGGRKKSGEVIGKLFEPIRARRKLALTGTPIDNRPINIYAILKYLIPEGFPTKTAFERRYCDLKLVRGRWDNTGDSNLDELQIKLRSTVMLRREKAEVLRDLPAKRRQVIELDPSGTVKSALKKEWEKSSFGKYPPDFENCSELRHESGLEKVKPAIAFIRDALKTSSKIVVFAYHRDVIEKVSKELGALTITGSTSLARRAENVGLFQNEPGARVLVGNIDAAGVGITLTASSHVIFIEGSWEPAKLSQAEDRTHRIGQKNSVLIQYLVWANSLDSYMCRRAIEKQEVIDTALDRELEFLQ